MAADGDAWLDRAAAGLLVLAGILVIATFRCYGVTWDEPGLRTYGRLLVDWYASGFVDDPGVRVRQPALLWRRLRHRGDAARAAGCRSTLRDPPSAGRAGRARSGMVLTWRLARRLGGPRAGLLAGLLLATMPGWWGHMFFNSKDVPFAVGMLAALLAWVRCLDQWPRPTLGSALLLGLAVGLTLGIRVGGILLGLYFGARPCCCAPSPICASGGLDRRHRRSLRGAVCACSRPCLRRCSVLIPAWPWVALAPGHLVEALGLSRAGSPTRPTPSSPGSATRHRPSRSQLLADPAGAAAARAHARRAGGRRLPPASVADRAGPVATIGVPLLLVAIAALFPLLYADGWRDPPPTMCCATSSSSCRRWPCWQAWAWIAR